MLFLYIRTGELKLNHETDRCTEISSIYCDVKNHVIIRSDVVNGWKNDVQALLTNYHRMIYVELRAMDNSNYQWIFTKFMPTTFNTSDIINIYDAIHTLSILR